MKRFFAENGVFRNAGETLVIENGLLGENHFSYDGLIRRLHS